ncbi:MAG TPA: hypothetical protein VGP43_03200 [Chitinophagaceae bacterium]|nr:hypothetical protein [Chitinophagaceae bacterium]
MNNFLRTIIAGYGAKKLGGGCLSTILIFIVIYWALGNCNSSNNRTTAPARPASLIQERNVAAILNADKSHNTASYSNHLSTSAVSK